MEGLPMSRRRRRQGVAPGVSPGFRAVKNRQPLKRAAEISVAPPGLLNLGKDSYPGLTPGAINMPPANAGSSRVIVSGGSCRNFLTLPNFLFSMIADK